MVKSHRRKSRKASKTTRKPCKSNQVRNRSTGRCKSRRKSPNRKTRRKSPNHKTRRKSPKQK